jgi:DNA polymerase-3 subunit delta'
MFNNIVGHDKIKSRLSSIFEKEGCNRTFMFYGPPCSGKRTVAFEYSKVILCNSHIGDECTCKSCIRFPDHPDFMCIGRNDKIKVADIEDILKFSETAPFLSSNKIVIIDNADSISVDVSNRLLKILEEPPSVFTFILVTSNPNNILHTVRSRCMNIKFGALSQMDMINVIMSKMGFEPVKARLLGWIGHGSAIDIFSKAGKYLQYRETALNFVSGIKHNSLISLIDFIDNIEKNDMSIFIDMIILIMTDIILLSNNIETIVNVDLRDDLKKISNNLNVKSLIISIGLFTQIKKYQYLNINLFHAIKNALIKSKPILMVEK